MRREIELNPELQTMREGAWVRTPFFEQEIYSSTDHHRLNTLFSHFTTRAKSLKSVGDWDGFISLHLPSHREFAFMNAWDEIPAPDHNRIAGQIWTDPAIIHSSSCFILAATRTDAAHEERDVMTREERAFLCSLPEVLTVFRSHETWNQLGPCWTLRESIAERFSDGYDWPELTSARVPRESVVAYFNRRREDEIIIRSSSDIEVIQIRELIPKTTER